MDTSIQQITQDLDRFIRSEVLGNRRAEPIRADEELLKGGIVDSIGFFKLLSFITEHFGVEHRDDELVPDNFRTLDIIAKRISQRQAKPSGSG